TSPQPHAVELHGAAPHAAQLPDLVLVALVLAGLVGLVVGQLDADQAPELVELEELPASEYTVDVRPEDERAVTSGRTIPANPDPNWVWPCPPGWQPKSKACWVPAGGARPPCPVATYEAEGRCWVPLSKGRKTPTSIEQ
ncbi:hypothetical protein ACLEPN_21525, partial [Myxococcus sp. 1LA]